jgi:hypothetical protein
MSIYVGHVCACLNKHLAHDQTQEGLNGIFFILCHVCFAFMFKICGKNLLVLGCI